MKEKAFKNTNTFSIEIDPDIIGTLPVKTCQNNWIPTTECVPFSNTRLLIETIAGNATTALYDKEEHIFKIHIYKGTRPIAAKSWRLLPDPPTKENNGRIKVYITNKRYISISKSIDNGNG